MKIKKINIILDSKYKEKGNKNGNLSFSADDAFLEKPSSGTLKIERSES
jgi:hypothetical protein